MALNKRILAAKMFDAISQSVGENIPSATRWPLCQALAEAIIDHITQYGEIVIPTHDPKMTTPAGAFVGPNFAIPPHQHEMVNLKHDTGKIQ